MKLTWAYTRAMLVEIARIPGIWAPLIFMPAILFLFFGARDAGDLAEAAAMMVNYAAFGVLGVAFFQFGVYIANDRGSPWEVFLRTLPAAPWVRLAARLLAGWVFSLVIILFIFLEARLLTPVRLEPLRWASLVLTLMVSSIPFGLLGLALGYWINPRAASAVANLLWIGLAYAGGLWGEPFYPLSLITPYLPTWLFVQATWRVALGQGMNIPAWSGLLIYAIAGGILAAWGYQRDEGLKYR